MNGLPPRGSRLLPALVDYYATNDVDRRPWASLPIDNNDISKGYKDISYSQLANAVDHAAGWLLKNLPTATSDFETIAYAGLKDLRYPILVLAVAKLRMRVCTPALLTVPLALAEIVELTGLDSASFAIHCI
jgi:hypothetical protein